MGQVQAPVTAHLVTQLVQHVAHEERLATALLSDDGDEADGAAPHCLLLQAATQCFLVCQQVLIFVHIHDLHRFNGLWKSRWCLLQGTDGLDLGSPVPLD